MFKWLKSRRGSKTKHHQLWEVNPQLWKQVQTIVALKDESEKIVVETERFLKKFEVANKANRCAADHLSVTLGKVVECVDRSREVFGEFYPNQIKAYDNVARIQRSFCIDVREKVIDQLRVFMTLDYVRIGDQIQKLVSDRCKWEKDAQISLPEPNSSGFRTKHQLKKDINRGRIQREYFRQMEIVNAEMAKLPRIVANHCKIVKVLCELLRGFHRDVAKSLLEAGASKM